MKNVKYNATDYKKLVLDGVVNAAGTGVTVTRDDGTTKSITPAQIFGDFVDNSVEVTITSKTAGPEDGDTVEIYDAINDDE